ncbi:MAG: hypothetical protein KatS3mg109_0136 [Pirellulaceae bacterium]|nr:MAG: hypothetical protein KatS3mg109_0136 [Pirellulaceae bacterium]
MIGSAHLSHVWDGRVEHTVAAANLSRSLIPKLRDRDVLWAADRGFSRIIVELPIDRWRFDVGSWVDYCHAIQSVMYAGYNYLDLLLLQILFVFLSQLFKQLLRFRPIRASGST